MLSGLTSGLLHFGTLDPADSSIREAQRLLPCTIVAVKILTIHHSISNPSLQSKGPGHFKYKREQIPHIITADPCISFSTKTPIFHPFSATFLYQYIYLSLSICL